MPSQLVEIDLMKQMIVDAAYPFASVHTILLKNEKRAGDSMHLIVFLKHEHELKCADDFELMEEELCTEPNLTIAILKGSPAFQDKCGLFISPSCSVLSIKITDLNLLLNPEEEFKLIFKKLEHSINELFNTNLRLPCEQHEWISYEINFIYFLHYHTYALVNCQHILPTPVMQQQMKRHEKWALDEKVKNKFIISQLIIKLEKKIQARSYLKNFFGSELKELLTLMKHNFDKGNYTIPLNYEFCRSKHFSLGKFLDEARLEFRSSKEFSEMKKS